MVSGTLLKDWNAIILTDMPSFGMLMIVVEKRLPPKSSKSAQVGCDQTNILTKNADGQAAFIGEVSVAGLSLVESSTGDLLPVVAVRRCEVQNRGHSCSVHFLLSVT